MIAVNLSAGFRLSRAVLRGMMKKRWGRIIYDHLRGRYDRQSGAGELTPPPRPGSMGMSKSLAAEVASRNITVNCVAPGFVVTPMTDALTEDQKTALFARIPVGRFGQPSDIGAAVVYLASEEAGYVTGQTLHANGGMAMI